MFFFSSFEFHGANCIKSLRNRAFIPGAWTGPAQVNARGSRGPIRQNLKKKGSEVPF